MTFFAPAESAIAAIVSVAVSGTGGHLIQGIESCGVSVVRICEEPTSCRQSEHDQLGRRRVIAVSIAVAPVTRAVLIVHNAVKNRIQRVARSRIGSTGTNVYGKCRQT